jgi:hypothetical protein
MSLIAFFSAVQDLSIPGPWSWLSSAKYELTPLFHCDDVNPWALTGWLFAIKKGRSALRAGSPLLAREIKYGGEVFYNL